MSEQPNEPIELPPSGDTAFATLMDTLVAEEGAEETGEGKTPATDAAGSDAGSGATGGAPDPSTAPAGGGEGATAAGGGDTGAAATGDTKATDADSGKSGDSDTDGDTGAGAGASPAAGDRPETWTATAAELSPKIGQLATALEDRTLEAYQQTALEEVKTEHEQYFTALEKHPRMLVGTQVPAIGKEGMETLKDAADAADWQEAVKSLLVAEVRDKASKAMDENSDFLTTIHASIELFQKNNDLIPGTKEFDVELANRFSAMVTPYELRVENKLQGYSIPVQPIIDKLRTQLVAERAAKSAAAADDKSAPPAKPAADPPQAGIGSKAGSSSEKEDFSTLFGTLGLHDFQI